MQIILCELGSAPEFPEKKLPEKELILDLSEGGEMNRNILRVVFSVYMCIDVRPELPQHLIELFSENLSRLPLEVIRNPAELGAWVVSARMGWSEGLTLLALSVPISLFRRSESLDDPSQVKAKVASLLASSIPHSYYAFNQETLAFELTCPAIPSICRHPFYEGESLPVSIEILPDSPEDRVFYSEWLPIDDPEKIVSLSRGEISRKISRHRGHEFLFKTGLSSFIPKYAQPILAALNKIEFYRKDSSPIFSFVQTFIQTPWEDSRAAQRALRSQLAISNMGEPFGFGVFNMGETIPAGTFLGIYEGELTRNTTYDHRHFVIEVEGDEKIQTSQCQGGYMGLLNHSVEGNAKLLPIVFLMRHPTKEGLAIPVSLACLMAFKDILQYEQVTYDYGPKYSFSGQTAVVFDAYGRQRRSDEKVRDRITGLDLD